VKYDPADFCVPPELEKGRSARVQCYIQSGHQRALDIIARSGVFPFDKDTDVIRWCIKYGLERLDQLEPKLINSVLRRANMMLEILKDEVARQKHLEVMEKSRTAIHGYLGRGEEEMARDLVQRLHKLILSMPDEPERELRWKVKYLEQLERDFKQYMYETAPTPAPQEKVAA
jgi:hypothetical protein